jgi:hypothetical protein
MRKAQLASLAVAAVNIFPPVKAQAPEDLPPGGPMTVLFQNIATTVISEAALLANTSDTDSARSLRLRASLVEALKSVGAAVGASAQSPTTECQDKTNTNAGLPLKR